MVNRASDPEYLRYQYGDSEKLRIRIETHERYSEDRAEFGSWILSHLDLRPGLRVLDVGCGPGTYHMLLGQHRARIVGIDASAGMVREARQQALDGGRPAAVARASAEALPLADATCDRAMANHMLYHVADQPQALRELRRVLRPGGRLVMATNAADHGRRFYDLHCQAARELGYTPLARGATRFTLDHLDLVHSVFPSAERHVLPNAFVFPTPDAALRYYASAWVDAIVERPPDGEIHRPSLMAAVESRIASIIAQEGVFRVPKDAGCFVAHV